jgi:hypothetical protein
LKKGSGGRERNEKTNEKRKDGMKWDTMRKAVSNILPDEETKIFVVGDYRR